MQDPIAQALLDAAEHGGAPAAFYEIHPDSAVEFGTGRNPFENMTITHWTSD